MLSVSVRRSVMGAIVAGAIGREPVRFGAMEIARAADAAYEHGDMGRFTGEVSLRGTVAADDGTNVGVVHFAAGARTHWHQHSGGQFLYAVTGRGVCGAAARPATCSRPAT